MSATLISPNSPAASLKDPCPRGRIVTRRRDPALQAWHRRLHAQIIAEKRPVSGRAGHYVYYWAYGHLCWRVCVVPKDPRTAVQLRSRAAFGAASETWSASQSLTKEQREAWRADAAGIRSTPRLGQSGPLTTQQRYVGRNALKERCGLALLLEPPKRESKKAESRTQNPEYTRKSQCRQQVARPSSGIAGLALDLRRPVPWRPPTTRPAPPKPCAALRAAREAPFHQHLTRPSSDRPHTAALPLPGQCRLRARSARRVRGMELPPQSSILTHLCRNARVRELWRGAAILILSGW